MVWGFLILDKSCRIFFEGKSGLKIKQSPYWLFFNSLSIRSLLYFSRKLNGVCLFGGPSGSLSEVWYGLCEEWDVCWVSGWWIIIAYKIVFLQGIERSASCWGRNAKCDVSFIREDLVTFGRSLSRLRFNQVVENLLGWLWCGFGRFFWFGLLICWFPWFVVLEVGWISFAVNAISQWWWLETSGCGFNFSISLWNWVFGFADFLGWRSPRFFSIVLIFWFSDR